jgi:urea transporter
VTATGRNAALAVLAAGGTSVVQRGLSASLAGTGLPALTLPFVVVTWVVFAAAVRR